AIGGVKSLPSNFGQIDLDPGVRSLRLRRILRLPAGVDVSTYVPGRNSEQPRQTDEQVGEVLTDAAPVKVNLERRGGQGSGPLEVAVLAEDRQVHVEQRLQQIAVVAPDEAHRVVGQLHQLRLW